MGAVKQWMIEQHNEDHLRELREWFFEKHGRWPLPSEMSQADDDKEQEEAFSEAMSKDD